MVWAHRETQGPWGSFWGMAGLPRRGLEGWVEKIPKSCFKVLHRVSHEHNSCDVL